jgi:CRISPR-associated exonuclease Cas4
MRTTGTHFAYYHICHRKLWLYANGINMEHTSETVSEGKLIHETSYDERATRYEEVEVGGSKIDFYNPVEKVVHEVKKSDSMEEAHVWQVKFYIWLLEQEGIEGVTGIIEYPTMRHREKVTLSAKDKETLLKTIAEVEQITESDECPPRVKKSICRSCSYHDFCWIEEKES